MQTSVKLARIHPRKIAISIALAWQTAKIFAGVVVLETNAVRVTIMY
jgi:hypothetical protein